MTTSQPTTGQIFENERTAEAGTVTVKVTGTDTHGVIFRHLADLLILDGRHCVCRSKSQPEIGSWVMVEINHEISQGKSDIFQGIVMSNQPEGEAGESFRVTLELETAQSIHVEPKPRDSPAAVRKLQELTFPVTNVESAQEFEIATFAAPPPPIPEANAQEHSDPFPNRVPVGVLASPDVLPKASVEILTTLQETIKSVVAAEATRQCGVLKSWLSSELDKRSQSIASPATEKTIREAVEKQISLNYQTAIQTFNNDLIYQLVARTLEETLRIITVEECNGLLCSNCSREMAQTFLYCPDCGTKRCANAVSDPIPVHASLGGNFT